ncbi:hypothetical protein JCM21900_001820 [Sporobolomyces salmonicolor]
MEILTEAESRDFGLFLDSFASSSSPGLPGSHQPSSLDEAGMEAAAIVGGAGLLWRRPHQPGWVAVSRGGALCGSAATPAGGWTGRHQPSTLNAGHGSSNYLSQHQPYPQHYSHPPLPSSDPSAFRPAPPSYPISFSAPLQLHPPTSTPSSAAHPLPSSLSFPTLPAQTLDAQKRARMQKHKEDLELWMAKAAGSVRGDEGVDGEGGGSGSGKENVGGAHAEDVEDEDAPSPPKRTRSSEQHTNPISSSSSTIAPHSQSRDLSLDDPIAKILEAERRAGYPGGRKPVLSSGGCEPRHVLSPPSLQRQPMPEPELEAEIPFALPPSPSKASKRKAATRSSASTTSSQNKQPSLETISASAPHPAAADYIESLENPNPAPAPTPSNVPRPPRRPRPAPIPHPSAPSSSSSKRSSTTPSSTSYASKPALLTAEQKKANHIASEQKRRAAIRAGYDGLCEVVPALKAAVSEFEERVRKAGEGGVGRGARKGKEAGTTTSKTGALMGGIEVGGEKIDGRAGPKSEAVVLSKTVDRVRQLLSTRSSLLARLSSAYASAADRGIPVPPAEAHEWDEHWLDEFKVKLEEGFTGREGGQEDEGMWEDDDEGR